MDSNVMTNALAIVAIIVSLLSLFVSMRKDKHDRWDKDLESLNKSVLDLLEFLPSKKDFTSGLTSQEIRDYENSLVVSYYYQIITKLHFLVKKQNAEVIFSIPLLDLASRLSPLLIEFPEYKDTHSLLKKKIQERNKLS